MLYSNVGVTILLIERTQLIYIELILCCRLPASPVRSVDIRPTVSTLCPGLVDIESWVLSTLGLSTSGLSTSWPDTLNMLSIWTILAHILNMCLEWKFQFGQINLIFKSWFVQHKISGGNRSVNVIKMSCEIRSISSDRLRANSILAWLFIIFGLYLFINF